MRRERVLAPNADKSVEHKGGGTYMVSVGWSRGDDTPSGTRLKEGGK